MFGALKNGFRRLATVKLVVNVVGKLHTEKNSCGMYVCMYVCMHACMYVYLIVAKQAK